MRNQRRLLRPGLRSPGFPQSGNGSRAAVAALAVGAWLASCGPEEDGLRDTSAATGVARDVGRESARNAPPDRLAFLVGIDHYEGGPAAGLGELAGCKNDIRRVRELLLRRFDFDAGDIHCLEDEQATLDRILLDFQRELLDRAGANTEVLIWFSGHGSRVPDASGSEGLEFGGLDSTLVAYDSRGGGREGGRDLSDDALHSLLTALAERTAKVLVVTDACHSGTVLRSAGSLGPLGVRAGRPGDEAVSALSLGASWPESIPFLDDHDRDRSVAPSYVHVAACGPGQLARELRVEGPDGALAARGALSLYLTRGLARLPRGGSIRSWVEEASLAVSTRVPSQTVWVEGELDRPLFGGPGNRSDGTGREGEDRSSGGFAVISQGSGVLALEGGAVHGLYPGLEMALRSEEGIAQGRVRLAAVTALHARADWISESPLPPPGRILWAHPRGPIRDQMPLELGWDPRLSEEERTEAREGLATLPALGVGGDGARTEGARTDGARTEGGPQDPDLRPDPWIRWVAAEEARYLLGRSPEGSWSLTEIDGPVLYRGTSGAPTGRPWSELTEVIEEERTWRRLMELPRQSGSLRLPARFRAPTPEELGSYAGYRDAGVEAVSGLSGFEVPGARLEDDALTFLEIENDRDRTLHVSVLSVTEDRGRHLLWPLEGRRDEARVAPGERISVAVQIALPESWDHGRPMLDRYLVIATERFADFSVFESGARILRGGAEDPGPELRELPEVLRSALVGGLRRGGAATAREGGDWGVGYVDLRVRPVRR